MSNRFDFGGLKENLSTMYLPRLFLFLFLLLSWESIAKAAAPLIGDVPDQVISQDTSTGTLYVVVGDMETAFTALSLTASSSNPMVVPSSASHLELGGFNAQRTITVTPAPGQTGTSVITLSVADGESLVTSSSFSVTVTTPNSAPVLSGLAGHQMVRPGVTAPALAFAIGDADHAPGTLGVTATSSNPSPVPDSGILLVGEGTSRTMQLTPLAGVTGSAVISHQKLSLLIASGSLPAWLLVASLQCLACGQQSQRQS